MQKKQVVLPVLIVGLSVSVMAPEIWSQGQSFGKAVAFAEDGENSGGDSQSNETSKDQSEANKKQQEKSAESAKKQQELQKEATKKQQESQKETLKQQQEVQRETLKQQAERNKQRAITSGSNSGVRMNDEDANKSNQETEAGDMKDGASALTDAQEKIAEAEKKILERQAKGEDVTASLTILQQAKDRLTAAQTTDTTATSSDTANTTKSLLKEAKRLADQAKEDDAMKNDEGEAEGIELSNHGKIISTAVHELQQASETEGGELGAKIRTIAQQQGAKAAQVSSLVEDIQSQSGVSKFFFGPKYDTLDTLKEKLLENSQDIATLNTAAAQVTDPALQTKITEQVKTLTRENDRLQTLVNQSEQENGLFGWVFRLFR